jgi:hypothetical protein
VESDLLFVNCEFLLELMSKYPAVCTAPHTYQNITAVALAKPRRRIGIWYLLCDLFWSAQLEQRLEEFVVKRRRAFRTRKQMLQRSIQEAAEAEQAKVWPAEPTDSGTPGGVLTLRSTQENAEKEWADVAFAKQQVEEAEAKVWRWAPMNVKLS